MIIGNLERHEEGLMTTVGVNLEPQFSLVIHDFDNFRQLQALVEIDQTLRGKLTIIFRHYAGFKKMNSKEMRSTFRFYLFKKWICSSDGGSNRKPGKGLLGNLLKSYESQAKFILDIKTIMCVEFFISWTPVYWLSASCV